MRAVCAVSCNEQTGLSFLSFLCINVTFLVVGLEGQGQNMGRELRERNGYAEFKCVCVCVRVYT